MGAINTVSNHVVPSSANHLQGINQTDSQSSYVSLSGIKSILSNAWSAVKSAFINMVSSFGGHLYGMQGSEKPGREITMDMSSYSRPLSQVSVESMENDYETMLFDNPEPAIAKTEQELKSRLLPQALVDENDSDYASVSDYAEANNGGEQAEPSGLKDESTGESIYATIPRSTVAQQDIDYWEKWRAEPSDMPPPIPEKRVL